jgi:hypothetical protein
MVDVGPAIEGVPNAAKLSKWSKDRSLEFIEIVMERVATFDEIRCF